MSVQLTTCPTCGGALILSNGAPAHIHVCPGADPVRVAAAVADAMADALAREGHPVRPILGRGVVVPDSTLARELGLSRSGVSEARRRGLGPAGLQTWLQRWAKGGHEPLALVVTRRADAD